MMKFRLMRYALLLTLIPFLPNALVLAQQTDRTPFALEFPELQTSKITAPKSYIVRSDVNVVKFWVFNPAAELIEWSKIKVRINRQAANVACSQNAATLGKVLRCDLNRIAGFRLQAKENLFEIEAESLNQSKFYGSFIVVTDAKLAAAQAAENPTPNKPANVTSAMGFSGRKFAVVIGVSTYQYNDIGLDNLRFADDDADALYQWLTQSGGFNPQNILYLTNENATLSAVRDSLNRFLTRATETDLILFFLAGHGTPDPFNPQELYYLVYDSKVADLRTTGLPMTELKQIIDTKLKSKRAIFLLDTCHSAGVSGRKIVASPLDAVADNEGTRNLGTAANRRLQRPVEISNNISETATKLFSSSGRAIITSSDTNETSRESERWGGGHGVFTWSILEGLRGAADANTDKLVTVEELFTFIHQKVRTETKNKQNPRILSNLSVGLEVALIK